MTVRTDIHRPSVIIPDDYVFVGFQHLSSDLGGYVFIQQERARIQRHMEMTGGHRSQHEHGGNCHICGAHCIYSAIFYHVPTNCYILTGLDCAENLEVGDVELFRRQVRAALEQVAGKRKAKAVLEQEDLMACWTIYEGGPFETKEENIIKDIVGKLVHYGNISIPQKNFLKRLLNTIARRAEIQAERALEQETAAVVPVNGVRHKVVGKVLSIRAGDDDYFGSRKMLVQHLSGWKVWGTVPSAIDVKVGDKVEFEAMIKVSDRDPKFGFFNRPTKAKIIS